MSSTNLKVNISYRQILTLALPISLSIFIPQFNYLTNNFFLGNYDKSGELLAMGGITGVYYLIFAVMGYGLNSGMQALISRRAGEDKIDEISKLFWNGIRIALMISVFAIFISYTIGSGLLQWSLKSQELGEKAIAFLKIRIWGLPMLLMFQMCNALLVSTNHSKFLLYATVADASANIFFDYVLIFGKWGFPELGFNGAAYASLIMEAVAISTTFAVLHFKGIFKKLRLFQNQKYNKDIMGLIAVQSLPLVFQTVISVASWELFFILVERHSQVVRGDALESSITNVMRNFFGIFTCTAWALASTCNTMVSNVIGQGFQDRVMEVVRMIMKLSVSFAVFFALCINIFPEEILSIYGQNEEFIREAIPIARVVSLAIICISMGAIVLNGVNGTANTRITLLIEIIATLLYTVYIFAAFEYWKLPFIIGWGSELVYWLSILGLGYWYLRSGRWRGKVV